VLLDIKYYGDPVLRKKCEKIKKITNEIKQLAANMIETFMYQDRGVGIAAPQVGVSVKMFVIAEPNYDDDQLTYSDPEVYINPVLSDPSDKIVTMDEGCLSLPKLRGEVSRPESITVSALDINGHGFKKRVSGYKARMIMHENDHLNGVLFIDRMHDAHEREHLKSALNRLKKKYKS